MSGCTCGYSPSDYPAGHLPHCAIRQSDPTCPHGLVDGDCEDCNVSAEAMPCTNCMGRGHFRDPEDSDVIDERNSGWFGQCRDCLGSGWEPERCPHGISMEGRNYRVARNLCVECRHPYLSPVEGDPWNEKELWLIGEVWAGAGDRLVSDIKAEADRKFPGIKTRFEKDNDDSKEQG